MRRPNLSERLRKEGRSGNGPFLGPVSQGKQAGPEGGFSQDQAPCRMACGAHSREVGCWPRG